MTFKLPTRDDLFVDVALGEPPATRWLARAVALAMWVIVVAHWSGASWPNTLAHSASARLSDHLTEGGWTSDRAALAITFLAFYLSSGGMAILAIGRALYIATFPATAAILLWHAIASHGTKPPAIIKRTEVAPIPSLGRHLRPPSRRWRISPWLSGLAGLVFILTWDSQSVAAIALTLALLSPVLLHAAHRCFALGLSAPRAGSGLWTFAQAALEISSLLFVHVELGFRAHQKGDAHILTSLQWISRKLIRGFVRTYALLRRRRQEIAVAVATWKQIDAAGWLAVCWISTLSLAIRIVEGPVRRSQGSAMQMALGSVLNEPATTSDTVLSVATLLGWLVFAVWLGSLAGQFAERRDFYAGRVQIALQVVRACRRAFWAPLSVSTAILNKVPGPRGGHDRHP